MIKFFKIIFLCSATWMIQSCSQVLQTVDLQIDTADSLIQEEFDVIEKTLTIGEAKKQKAAPYSRAVLKNGRGEIARPIPEKLALKSEFPKNNSPTEYRIGIGDTITFSRLIENNKSPLSKNNTWPKQKVANAYKLGIGDTLALILIRKANDLNITTPIGSNSNSNNSQKVFEQGDVTIKTQGRIGPDGSVLLLEVGRLEAKGKSLNELRSEVRNILIRNGVSPRFQLEIVNFKSQKSYLTISSNSSSNSRVIYLSDQKTTIQEVVTSAGVGITPGVITRVRLQRDGKEFSVSLRDLYGVNVNNIDIQPNDHIFVEDSSAKMVSSPSVVDHEGNVIFEGIGKTKAAGLTLSELKKNIKNLVHPLPDSQNEFQIQIKTFASQKALLSIEGNLGVLIPITDSPVTIAEVLIQNGLSIDGNHINQISLKRGTKIFVFTLSDLLNPNSPDLYIQADDRLTTTILPYKENKVFILGGVSPQIFKINPANRETLADVLFTSGGPLSKSSAKRSEVYLLRGKDPVVAYHLDAQSPTRLIVADTMELRPNDILYVAEQPIISFNRALATIVPIRILLRDIQDDNIP